MRISVWNIQNGGGKRIHGIVRALAEAGSDLCVLSEYSSTSPHQLIDALGNHGFNNVLHTQPEGRQGGVLVAAKTPIQLGDIGDCPSPDRWLHVLVPTADLEIGAAYIPNSERSRTEKFEYWQWLLHVGTDLVHQKAIICGDFNTGLPYVDEDGKTLVCAEPMAQMLEFGWTDLWRRAHPERRESSWWSNAGNGFRLDHALASPSVGSLCQEVEYKNRIGDQCVVHPKRLSDGCTQRPLSDHSLMVVELA